MEKSRTLTTPIDKSEKLAEKKELVLILIVNFLPKGSTSHSESFKATIFLHPVTLPSSATTNPTHPPVTPIQKSTHMPQNIGINHIRAKRK